MHLCHLASGETIRPVTPHQVTDDDLEPFAKRCLVGLLGPCRVQTTGRIEAVSPGVVLATPTNVLLVYSGALPSAAALARQCSSASDKRAAYAKAGHSQPSVALREFMVGGGRYGQTLRHGVDIEDGQRLPLTVQQAIAYHTSGATMTFHLAQLPPIGMAEVCHPLALAIRG